MTGDASLASAAPVLLSASQLVRHFSQKKLMPFTRAQEVVRAVDGISFELFEGETLAVIGESGCGKSTTARLLMQLLKHDQGELRYRGELVGSKAMPLRTFRRSTQMVFQDSYASLNPRMTIEDSIAYGPMVHGLSRNAANQRARTLLDRVGLEPQRFAGRYPHELSGGQRQRVNIARALALEPRLLILDEAVSALDKTVEAQVLNLLADLKHEFALTYLFISHDLNVVRFIADRVLVMYLGQVIEIGDSATIFAAPAHPYTGALLHSIPSIDPLRRTSVAPLAGDPPNPINPPSGCRFHPRCTFAKSVCAIKAPELKPVAMQSGGRQVACFMAQQDPDYHD
jgi:peptide/nickel transport system ATP-binding protein